MDFIMWPIAMLLGVFGTVLSTEVKGEGDTIVAFNQDASFSCLLLDPKGVSQVTWQKLVKGNAEDLATYSTRYGENVLKPNILFTKASLNATSITVKNATVGDEGCYRCTFHVYPSGSVRKQTCLTVQGISSVSADILQLPNSETTLEKTVVVSCSATGKPAPEVKWSVEEENRVQKVINEDGTVSVSANLTLRMADFPHSHVECVVRSPSVPGNLTKRIDLPEHKRDDDSDANNTYSGVVIGAILAVFVIIFAVACLCFIRKRKKGCEGNAPEWCQRKWCYYTVSTGPEENQMDSRFLSCLP